MTPKNQREIDLIAAELSIELMKIQKVFDVRCRVFSTFMSVKPLLRELLALYQHFGQLSSPDSQRNCKENARFSAMA